MSSAILVPRRLYTQEARGLTQEPISDEAYLEAMRSFIIVCSDVIIVWREYKTVVLARRRILPVKDWWMFGGRRFAGETPEQAAVHHFAKDTTVTLDPNRLQYIAEHEYIWDTNEQDPNQGCHVLAHTFSVELTRDEMAAASDHLNPSEYDPKVGLASFDLDNVMRRHPAIQDIYRDLFGR